MKTNFKKGFVLLSVSFLLSGAVSPVFATDVEKSKDSAVYERKNISSADVSLNGTSYLWIDQEPDADAISLDVSLDGQKLTRDRDYNVSVENFRDGIGTVEIKGINDYKGSIEKSFSFATSPSAWAKNIREGVAIVTTQNGLSKKKYTITRGKETINTFSGQGNFTSIDTKAKNGKKYTYSLNEIVGKKKHVLQTMTLYRLDAPKGIKATRINSSVTVSWKKNKKADGYYVTYVDMGKPTTKKLGKSKTSYTFTYDDKVDVFVSAYKNKGNVYTESSKTGIKTKI